MNCGDNVRKSPVVAFCSTMLLNLLKSVRVHFAPRSNRQSFPLEYLNCMVAAPSMLHIEGEMLKETCAIHVPLADLDGFHECHGTPLLKLLNMIL